MQKMIQRPEKYVVQKRMNPDVSAQIMRKSFSPVLTGMLSLVISDGLCNSTAFSLLRDLQPYVSAHDSELIGALIANRNSASKVLNHHALPSITTHSIKRTLTPNERMHGMLKVLKKYGGQSSNSVFTILERMILMQQRMTGNNGMLDLVSMLMGGGVMPGSNGNDIGTIMNLMNMMGGNNSGGGKSGNNNGGDKGGNNNGGGMDISKLMGMMGGGNGGMDMSKLMSMMGGGGGMDISSLMSMMGGGSGMNIGALMNAMGMMDK